MCSRKDGARARRGASIIDLVVSLGILALLFGGIYLVYFSIIDAVANIEARSAATTVLNQEVEVIRNLPYDQVGTEGGVPSGVLPQSRAVSIGNYDFVLTTTIRNIDDPFDGTAAGTPADTAPADYKLVAFEVACANCLRFTPLNFTTTVAPKNLESASSAGSLFVNVFDAAGQPVAGATVRIQNPSTTPAIDLADVTTNDGVLQLVGVPTSTQNYRVQVSKNGYSSEQTYALGATGNPNPAKPHATVAVQSVTNISFAIDRVSDLTVYTSGPTCSAYGNRSVSVSGAKVIGTSPDVLKFSTTTTTGADGSKVLADLEWDSYALVLNGTSYDVAGTMPFSPMLLSPGVDASFRFVLQPADPSALLVAVKDAGTGSGIEGATVTLSRSGFTAARTTGRSSLEWTDWSDGEYAEKSGGMDATSAPGSLILFRNPETALYPAGADETLTSETIDLGGATSTVFTFAFEGSEPAGTTIKFQLAGNNGGSTWNFTGPDGTPGSYYTDASSAPAAAINGKRYIRYKAFLATSNPAVTPSVGKVSLEFNSVCVPTAHAFFNDLATGTYTLETSASGYATDIRSVSVSDDWQSVEIPL